MTKLFNATEAINIVGEYIIDFDGIIAGGAVADHYFNVEAKDIDIVVSRKNHELATTFMNKGFFTAVGKEDTLTRIESYGGMSSGRNQVIHQVYKGKIAGYPVDIIVVEDADPRTYVESFDLNIKKAYFDGRFHYSTGFMQDVTDNTVTTDIYEPTGYIRAKQAADKYGMQIDRSFELSRQYVSYVKSKSRYDLISAKYHGYVETTDFGSFDMHVVQAADLFTIGKRDHKASYTKSITSRLVDMVTRDVQTHHPIVRDTVSIEIESDDFDVFISMASALVRTLSNEARSLATPLVLINKNEFADGLLLDNGRVTKINKYLNKILRKLPEFERTIKTLMRLIETRTVKSGTHIRFSADTKDLLEISTNKGWSSCQGWSFNHVTDYNYRTLANLGGATVVGIFEGDKGKWDGRFLVRIGEDNALFLEDIYSHRSELTRNSSEIMEQVADALREKGYIVFIDSSVVPFAGLPMFFTPYNDINLNLVKKGNTWSFKEKIMRRIRRGFNVMDGIGIVANQPYIGNAGNVAREVRAGLFGAELAGTDLDPFANVIAAGIDDDGDGNDLPF